MRVLVNGICNNRYGGLFGNFVHMLLLSEALSRRSDIQLRVLADEFTSDVYRERLDRSLVIETDAGHRNLLGREKVIHAAIAEHKPDVFHRPTGQLPLRRLPCAAVMTVPDLNWKELPTPFHVRLFKDFTYARSVRQADAITCVSKYTEASLLKAFPEANGKTRVIYHGATEVDAPSCKCSPGSHPPYFLTFGHLPHKNVETCIRALAQCRHVAVRLVVIGDNAYVTSVLKPLAEQLGVAERVDFPGRVHKSELANLYTHAEALLFMSIFEGFGLPILEAMNAGCPVVGANTTSLPEVIGDGGIQIGPHDVRGLAAVMESLIDSPDLRADLISRGRKWAGQFSWDRAAEETVEVYRFALHNHRSRR